MRPMKRDAIVVVLVVVVVVVVAAVVVEVDCYSSRKKTYFLVPKGFFLGR